MKQMIIEIFGKGQDLGTVQMAARAVLMFFITLALIRIGGLRIFGKRDAFDNIIAIMMGALLSRGVTGASSFLSVVAATSAMVLVHRVLAQLSIKSRFVERMVKGKKIILFRNGEVIKHNLWKTSLTMADLMESLREETLKDSLEEIELATMETNGKISFVIKKGHAN